MSAQEIETCDAGSKAHCENMRTDDLYQLPADLPVPVDDGAARHLIGAALPPVALPSTGGGPGQVGRCGGSVGGGVLLSAHRSPRCDCIGRHCKLERDTRSPWLHTAVLCLPRSPSGIAAARRARLRPEHTAHGLPT